MNDEEKGPVAEEWRRWTNMTAEQLESWGESPVSRLASQDPAAVIARNLRLLRTPVSDWNDGDYEDARRTVSFNQRMSAVAAEGGEDVRADVPFSKAEISLINWAWRPASVSPEKMARWSGESGKRLFEEATSRGALDKSMERLTTAAVPRSIDESARTVEAVISTPDFVTMRSDDSKGGFIEFQESLSLEGVTFGHVALKDQHRAESATDVVGTVENIRVEGQTLVGTLRFADTDKAEDLWKLVRGGHLPHVSVGYVPLEREAAGDGKVRTTKWQLYEVSLVEVPANPRAAVRSAAAGTTDKEAREADEMTPEEIDALKAELEAAKAELAKYKEGESAERSADKPEDQIAKETERASAIVSLCTTAGRPADAIRHITEKKSVQEVAAMLNGNTPLVAGIKGGDESDKFKSQAVAAVRARYERKASAGVAPMTFSGLLRECLHRDGVNSSTANGQDLLLLAKRSGGNTTSDYSQIVDAVVRAQVLDSWNEYQGIWRQIARVINVVDFRDYELHDFGGVGSLPELHQNQDVPFIDNIKGKVETVRATNHAGQIRISDELLVNDAESLNVFGSLASRFSVSANRTIEQFLFQLIKAGKTMNEDGQNTYRTANIITGASKPPAVAQLNSVRAAMAQFKDLGGNILNVQLGKILVPEALRTTAEELVNSTANPASSNSGVTNVFRGLEVVSSPYLDQSFTIETLDGKVTSAANTAAWYGLSAAGSPQAFVVALKGDSPMITEETSIGYLGRKYQVSMPFGVSVGDWRGVVKVNNA